MSVCATCWSFLIVCLQVIKGAYGFCIIEDYDDILECLGEEILPFTNTAADVVHKAVVSFKERELYLYGHRGR